MRLYIEGHSPRHGYAISKTWSDQECRMLPPPTDGETDETKPVRWVECRKKAFTLVERWNRRFATHTE